MIGAEGGFDEAEIMEIEAAGFQSVGLGPRILRTETAGPAAITICQVFVGDL
jgi:16S rRNA (uracil1498-N3)-methyltransferase